MPNELEAKIHKYTFIPVPMDPLPPIDPRTFNHYIHKPHAAEAVEKWVKRFPKLRDASLFYAQEQLAKGWGIEITEDRNWPLFLYANLTGLLLSGGVAALYASLKSDVQTAVAIGAWLSAVQTFAVTILFWRWTNI